MDDIMNITVKNKEYLFSDVPDEYFRIPVLISIVVIMMLLIILISIRKHFIIICILMTISLFAGIGTSVKLSIDSMKVIGCAYTFTTKSSVALEKVVDTYGPVKDLGNDTYQIDIMNKED